MPRHEQGPEVAVPPALAYLIEPPNPQKPEVLLRSSLADNVTRLTCRHYREAAARAEAHLRRCGLFGRWQRSAFAAGWCTRCGGDGRG